MIGGNKEARAMKKMAMAALKDKTSGSLSVKAKRKRFQG